MGASQCHLVHCGRQLRPLGLAPGKLRQRVAQGQNGILALGDMCVGVVVRCVIYSEWVRGLVTALAYARVNCVGFVTYWMTI